MWKHLAGIQYDSEDNIISTVDKFSSNNLFTSGIYTLQYKWKKCVNCNKDYVEK